MKNKGIYTLFYIINELFKIYIVYISDISDIIDIIDIIDIDYINFEKNHSSSYVT